MSGLNIRSFAKVEPLNDEDRSENQHGGSEMQPVASQQDSDDSDAGIQYLAPDETPCDPATLTFPKPSTYIVPKTENSMLMNDGISEEQGFVVKSEMRANTSNISSQVFNEIRPVIESDIPGYEKDVVQERQLEAMGLPTNFNQGMAVGINCGGTMKYVEQQTVRKGQKSTYYCEICMLDLNSDDTMISHTKGVKHIKKKIAMEEKNATLRSQGIAAETKVVRQVPNPLPLQKKVPIRLEEKLRESREAIVGLDNILETIACSNAEVEPYYECLSCGTQGEANGMYNHLVGRNHRERFIEKKFPDDPRYIDMNARALKVLCEKYKENDEVAQKISTTYSDEMYPWTAGKAPWSVEQGGTGTIPTGARNNVNITAMKTGRGGGYFGPHVDSKEGIVKTKMATNFQSLDPDNLEGDINSVNDVKHCLTLMQGLLKKAERFLQEEVVSNEKEDVMLVVSEIDASLEVLKGTEFKKDVDDDGNHPSPSPPQRHVVKRERSYSPNQPYHRNPSPPRGYMSPSYRSYARSPPNGYHRNSHSRSPNSYRSYARSPPNSRSPNSTASSSRDYDSYGGRNGDGDSYSRSNRYDRERHRSHDRYRDRDDYDSRGSRERSARR